MAQESENPVFPELLSRIRRISEEPTERYRRLLEVARVLEESVSHYDWVGFYIVDESKKDELALGPFVGKPTEHTRIHFGQGICGQAADRGETFVVGDVTKETNYLSCSPEVKSEIVVPIFKGGRVVAELDIDSHQFSPFTEEEQSFLEEVCAILSDTF